jgi:hypothetical protein
VRHVRSPLLFAFARVPLWPLRFASAPEPDTTVVLDHSAGGNLITKNLLFNTGRAANKDEGSINTWDRVPYASRFEIYYGWCISFELVSLILAHRYITAFRNGTASTIPAWNTISKNFLIGNYDPSLAIDNDDGECNTRCCCPCAATSIAPDSATRFEC